MGSGSGERGGKGTGNLRSISGRVQNRPGKVKNNMGNGEAKELVCTTHGQ